MIVRDVMRPMLETVKPEMPVTELGRFFSEKRISGAPVLEEGRLIGVVSVRDLFPDPSRARDRPSRPDYFRDLWMEEGDVPALSAQTTTVRDIMNPVVFTIEETASISDLTDLMLRSCIHRVIVKARGGPIGIVTTSDLVGLLPTLEGR